MGPFLLLFATSLILAVALIVSKYFKNVNYWKQNHVDTIDFIKHFIAAKKTHVALLVNEIYRKMCSADKPLAALETLFFTVVILRDLEAIKNVMITNYEDFPDRGFYVNNRDPISMNIARLEYDRWKMWRHKFNPTFTPAKIKGMFPTVLKVAEQLVGVIKEQVTGASNFMEACDLSIRYTTDIVGNVVFGIDCNSLKDPKAEFRTQSDNVYNVVLPLYLEHMAAKYPKLFNFFNVQVYPKALNEFFTRLARETVEYRLKHNIRRNDFMDILIELRKTDESITFEFIAGQAFAFFVAGSQSSANTMSFALFELARNPDTQAKARKSVEEQLDKHDNQWTYESVQNMEYIKKVVHETLRKYPVGAMMPRICKRTCYLASEKGSFRIKQGTSMIVPVYAIHHDPLYYPKPELFRPERFDEGEISKRPANTYLPFGIGPKACLADRFAKMNLTLVLALLLKNYRFSICEQTPQKLVFDPGNMFICSVKDGIYLKVDKV